MLSIRHTLLFLYFFLTSGGVAFANTSRIPVYLHFFDWFGAQVWNESTFVEPFDWSKIGTSLADRGTEKFYEQQFRYIKKLGVSDLAWEFNATRGGTLTYPPQAAVDAARIVGLGLAPVYDLEITLQVYSGSPNIRPELATPGAITATPETSKMICKDLSSFYTHVPTNLIGHDAKGSVPIFVFGFGFDDTHLDPALWNKFSDTLKLCMTRVAGPNFKFYWSATNHPMEEHLFQHDRNHFVPWQFVSDMPQSQFAPDSVTLNFGFDNLGVQRRDHLPRVIRVDPRYIEEAAWVAASTRPSLLFIYGWNEPFEGSFLFPSKTWGEMKGRLASYFIHKIQTELPALPKTLIIADDLDDLYTTRKGDWHLTLLREMLLYRMRLLAPQSDVILESQVTPEILHRYQAIIDLTSAKSASLVNEVIKAGDDGARLLVFDPLAHVGPDSYATQFFSTLMRNSINAEVNLGNGTVFVRDDSYSGEICSECKIVLEAHYKSIKLPLVIAKGRMTMVNSYSNDDKIMTAAFAAFYDHPMGTSLLYGEGLKSQRLEISPNGTVQENHLSRGSVDELIPMPPGSDWDRLPPEVSSKFVDFLYNINPTSGDQ